MKRAGFWLSAFINDACVFFIVINLLMPCRWLILGGYTTDRIFDASAVESAVFVLGQDDNFCEAGLWTRYGHEQEQE